MTYSLTLETSSLPSTFLPIANRSEFTKVEKYVQNSKRTIDYPEWLFYPVRTDTLSNFAKDFLAPSFCYACTLGKTHHFATKFFMSCIGLFLDLATLPLRVITCIPRCIFNALHSKTKDSFYHYLIGKGISSEFLKGNEVEVQLKNGYSSRASGIYRFTQWPKLLSSNDDVQALKHVNQIFEEQSSVNFSS